MASRLDCCGKCEIEEDTENLADMFTHTPSTKELEEFRPLMILRSCSERNKDLMTTKQYKPVPVGNAKVYSYGWETC